ncbi:MAG TPA: hypothetical protein DDY49_14580 [Paenibacillaceae bacterium]|nr:hypothetical protein [Paenibacillaceae bacterium]
MERWPNKPLQVSEMLDLMFQIMKKHFPALFLIMIILLVPLFLVQGLALWGSGFSLIRADVEGPWYMTFMDAGISEDLMANLPLPQMLILFFSAFVMAIIFVPLAEAAIIIAVDRIRKGEKIQPIAHIKQAFSRFWGLLGGSFVYGIISGGLVLLVLLILGALGGLIWFTDGFSGNVLLLVLVILGMIAFGIGGLIGSIYLSVRISFNFAVIVFEKVSPALTQSWNLTRKNFWRLFVIALVIMILTGIISSAFEGLFTLILGMSVLSTLLSNIVNLFTYLMSFVVYAIVYFDLKLRNEGTDLQRMMEDYRQETFETQGNTIEENIPTDK